MIFGKDPPVIVGGAAVVRARAFRLDPVIEAYESVIDRLSAVLAPSGSTVTTPWRTEGAVGWPTPGKDLARGGWRGLASNYDATPDAFLHAIGPATVRACLLGKDWAVYDPRTGRVTTPQWKDPARLDGIPLLEVFGRDLPDGGTVGVDLRTIRAVERAVTKDLASLRLAFTLIDAAHLYGHDRFVALVRFPSAVYGRGEDWIRVRCVLPDGREIDPIARPN